MALHTLVGVDIGTDSIRAVEVAGLGKGKPTVLRFQEIALPDGAVKAGEVVEVNTVAAALKQLWSAAGFKSKDVVLGVGNPKVLVRDLTVPKLSAKEMRLSLSSHVQDMLPVPVVDALLDFYPVSESATDNGPVVHGLLVAAVKESVTANVNAVQLAGLTPVAVDLIPFALSRLHTRGGVQGTLAFIDVGSRTTNVVVTTDGVPQFVRIIGVGGNNLTAALVDRIEVSSEQAEAIKRSLGIASGGVHPDHAPAAGVIRDVTSDLLTSLRNTLSYYINTHPGTSFNGVVLSGGGAMLPGFVDALGEITRIPIGIADPFSTIELSRDLQKSEQKNHRSMSVALGLALGSAA